jgi:nucleoside-diphosphate-sugar epimerase
MELEEATLARELCSYPRQNFVNLGTGVDVTISQLAQIVQRAVGYCGALRFDPGKPDGTPRKLLDVSRMTALGWRARISLAEGIAQTYAWFLEHPADLRK